MKAIRIVHANRRYGWFILVSWTLPVLNATKPECFDQIFAARLRFLLNPFATVQTGCVASETNKSVAFSFVSRSSRQTSTELLLAKEYFRGVVQAAGAVPSLILLCPEKYVLNIEQKWKSYPRKNAFLTPKSWNLATGLCSNGGFTLSVGRIVVTVTSSNNNKCSLPVHLAAPAFEVAVLWIDYETFSKIQVSTSIRYCFLESPLSLVGLLCVLRS